MSYKFRLQPTIGNNQYKLLSNFFILSNKGLYKAPFFLGLFAYPLSLNTEYCSCNCLYFSITRFISFNLLFVRSEFGTVDNKSSSKSANCTDILYLFLSSSISTICSITPISSPITMLLVSFNISLILPLISGNGSL